MADWDANSPQLLHNLLTVGREAAAAAGRRAALSSETVRTWQKAIMEGLTLGDGEPIGAFRGERGLLDYDVEVGGRPGLAAAQVRDALAQFDHTLLEQLAALDAVIRPGHFGEDLDADRIGAASILCAWAHGEWIRIHPFPNGNGRTARLLVNTIGLRYGLPAFLRLRPRPGPEYTRIAREAMDGRWEAAIPFFERLYMAALGG